MALGMAQDGDELQVTKGERLQSRSATCAAAYSRRAGGESRKSGGVGVGFHGSEHMQNDLMASSAFDTNFLGHPTGGTATDLLGFRAAIKQSCVTLLHFAYYAGAPNLLWSRWLPYNPESVVGEILGRRARKGANPGAENHLCPFIKSRCPKRSTNLPGEPYPVCSLWRKPDGNSQENLIFVCPKRFYAVDFLKEVVAHCWPGDAPKNPQVAPEVKMDGFGNVDFVIADVRDDGEIQQFLSVELQAIDITGSVFPAYEAIRGSSDLERKPTYGFNWDNVYKRYITQLIRKGYFHHHWKTKIVAVIPEQVYDYIVSRADFLRSPDVKSPQVNIIFMTYRLTDDPARPGEFKPELVKVEGTSHSNLQNAILYKEAPSKEVFSEQIKRSLVRPVKLSDFIEAEPLLLAAAEPSPPPYDKQN